MAVVEWPAAVKKGALALQIMSASVAAPRGLDGRRQVIFRESRYWSGTVPVTVMQGATIGYFRAMVNALRGRSGILRLPVPNLLYPTPDDGIAYLRYIGFTDQQIEGGAYFFSDGSGFDDGSGFTLPGNDDPTVGVDAPVGATILTVSGAAVAVMDPGAWFSIEDYLYEVVSRDGAQVTFAPPLRSIVTAGDEIALSTPHIRVHLDEDAAGRVMVEPGVLAMGVSLPVVEAFDR